MQLWGGGRDVPSPEQAEYQGMRLRSCQLAALGNRRTDGGCYANGGGDAGRLRGGGVGTGVGALGCGLEARDAGELGLLYGRF